MLDYRKKNEIERIRKFLMKSSYDIYYQNISGMYNYFFNPWQKYEVLRRNLMKYAEEIRLLFRLLMMGEELDAKIAKEFLTVQFIEDLLSVKFLKENEGKIRSNGYAFIPYLERYFVVNLPLDYPTSIGIQDIYIGFDSYKLTNVIPHMKHKNHLDLCSGSGIQCIMGADAFEQGYAVEINENVISALKFNIALNDLKNKIKVVNGNLYSSLQSDIKFDVITANPPFLPVPENVDFPIAGDGGGNGLEVIHNILSGFNQYLSNDGMGIIIGEAIGDKKGPFLMNLIHDMLSYGYDGELFLQAINKEDDYISQISRLYTNLVDRNKDIEEVSLAWKNTFKKYNASYVYAFILKIRRRCDNKKSVFKQIKNYIICDDDCKPAIIKSYRYIESPANYFMVVDNKVVATINKEFKQCIELCDGNHTINQMMDIVLNNENDDKAVLSNAFIKMCNALKEQNIMNIVND